MKPIFTNCKIVGHDISNATYIRQEPGVERGNPVMVMSRSSLSRFCECPSKWKKSKEEEATDSMEFGTLLDTALLAPDKFEELYVVAPATYTNDKMEEKDWNYNAKFCKAWRDERESKGKKVIKQTEMDELEVALKSVSENPFMKGLLGSANCKKQVMIVGWYEDEATGLKIPMKCLIDVVPNKGTSWSRYLADLKTTRSANPHSFEKDVDGSWYDAQAWLFLEMLNAANGALDIKHPDHRDSFQWALCENTPPFEVPDRHPAIYEDGEFMELGKAKILRALKQYCQCLKTGHWPSYNPSPRLLIGEHSYVAQPKPWMLAAGNDQIPDLVVPPDPYEKTSPDSPTGAEMPEIGIIP